MNLDLISIWRVESIFGSSPIDDVIDDSNPNIVYHGFAIAGTTTDKAGWLIIRTKKDATSGFTFNRIADSSMQANKIFNDRAGYSYVEA